MVGAYLVSLPGLTPYEGAWALQRSIAGAVMDGVLPDTVLLLEHEPVVTLGRRTDEAVELHLPGGVQVDVVETNRGGKSTYHGPGQLVCYPILDLNRHGRDLKRYVRELEEAIIRTLAAFELASTRIDGLTGVWVGRPHGGQTPAGGGQSPAGGGQSATGTVPWKIASIGVHASRWVTTHGYALNVDLDPAPFTDWITACGLEGAHFTTMARELGTPLQVAEVRPAAATAIADVFGLHVEELSVEDVEALVAQEARR
jgi:lipoate-protein ligase B